MTRHNEIDKIYNHISQGCLSGIGDGDGTGGNEALHRLLNRSLLCGSSILGPELALAILTALLYTYNCKIRGEKHTNNAKVTPILPVEGHASLSQYLSTEITSLVGSHFKIEDYPVSLHKPTLGCLSEPPDTQTVQFFFETAPSIHLNFSCVQ